MLNDPTTTVFEGGGGIYFEVYSILGNVNTLQPLNLFFQGVWKEKRGNVDSREAHAQYASGVRPFFARITELEAERPVDSVVLMDPLEQVR